MYTVIFETHTAGLLRINGGRVFELSQRPVTLRLPQCFIMEFMPFAAEYENLCRKVDLCLPQCEDAKFAMWGNCTVTVFLLPKHKRVYRPLIALAQAEFQNCLVTLCDDGENYMLFEDGLNMTVFPIPCLLTEAKLGRLRLGDKDNLLLRGKGQSQQYFGVYDVGNRVIPIFEGTGEEFLAETNEFILKKKVEGQFGAVVEYRYYFDGKECRLKNTKLVGGGYVFREELTEYQLATLFFEGIAAECYEMISPILSTEMRESFEISAAKEFFGDFKEIHTDPIGQGNVALLYDEGACYTVKRYHVETIGGIITNISSELS